METAYNNFFDLCEEGYATFGDILDLPVGVHPYDYVGNIIKKTEILELKLLDFGCGVKKPMQKVLQLSEQQYFSCDDDPSGDFSYRSIEEIPEAQNFELITSSHALEHLSFDDGIKVVAKLSKYLKHDGSILIAVPNPKHPTRYLSSPVHVTPWNYLNIYSMMVMADLKVIHCARYNKFPRPPFYIRPLINLICRYFMMDWADSIFVVGKKK